MATTTSSLSSVLTKTNQMPSDIKICRPVSQTIFPTQTSNRVQHSAIMLFNANEYFSRELKKKCPYILEYYGANEKGHFKHKMLSEATDYKKTATAAARDSRKYSRLLSDK
jgi:hypothetical protein